MKRRVAVLLLVFVVSFVTLLAIALPDGRATVFLSVPATAHADEVVSRLGYHDAARYIRVGRDLSVGDRSSTHFFNNWPPGVPAFNAVLFTIFGSEMPVGVILAIAAAALWALVLTAWFDLLNRFMSVVVAGIIVAAVVLSSVMSWLLGTGLFLSEGLFTVCLLGALYAATRGALASTQSRRYGWAGGVGLMLAAAAYMRVSGELIGRTLTFLLIAWAALALVVHVIGAVRDRGRDEKRKSPLRSSYLAALLMCVVAFQVLTIPWRIVAAQTVRPDNYAWTTVYDHYWHMQWIPDRVFKDPPPGFAYQVGAADIFLAGGANTVCKVEPRTCAAVARHELQKPYPFSGRGKYSEDRYQTMALRVLREQPVAWMWRRAELLPHAWFSAVPPCAADNKFSTCRAPLGIAAHGHELVENALLLAALLGALGLSVARIRRVGADLLALLVPTAVLATMVPLVFLEYEVRFFFPLKIVSVFAVAVLFALRTTGAPAANLSGENLSGEASSVA